MHNSDMGTADESAGVTMLLLQVPDRFLFVCCGKLGVLAVRRKHDDTAGRGNGPGPLRMPAGLPI